MKEVTIVILLIIFSSSLFGQKKNASKNSVKRMVIYEQKLDKGSGKKMIDSEIKFDNNGNVTEEITFKDGKIDKHVKCEYDAKGNKVKETEFGPNGKPTKIIEYKYKGDLRIERNAYDTNNKLKSKKTYEYDFY